jgi:hypothetical protein
MRTRFAESNLKFFELNQDDMDDLDVCLLPEYLSLRIPFDPSLVVAASSSAGDRGFRRD